MLQEVREYFESKGFEYISHSGVFQRLATEGEFGPYVTIFEKKAYSIYLEETGRQFPTYSRDNIPIGTEVWVPAYGTCILEESREWYSGRMKIWSEEGDYVSGNPTTEGERFSFGDRTLVSWEYIEDNARGLLNELQGIPHYY